MPFEKSAGAIIFRKDGNIIWYLLLHYEAGHWEFPKGHVEKGESEIQTVKREVKEETGISDIELIGGFKEYTKYFFRAEGKNIFKIVTFYLAKTDAREVKISFEHIGCDWLPYKDALDKISFKASRDILKRAHEFLKNKYKIPIIEELRKRKIRYHKYGNNGVPKKSL